MSYKLTMAKSYFIQNTQRANVNRAQLRRLSGQLEGKPFGLTGPFSDKSGAIEGLASEISSRYGKGGNQKTVDSVVAALTPVNFPLSSKSRIPAPFYFCPAAYTGSEQGAGAVAAISAENVKYGLVRKVDMEGLTLVGVAVLRKLGVPAFFSYSHVDPNHESIRALRSLSEIVGLQAPSDAMPSILAFTPEPRFLSLLPPAQTGLPASVLISGFEIIDEDALRSILLIKAAYKQCLKLMREMGHGESADHLAGFQTATAIGHILHQGLSLWDEEEAYRCVAEAQTFLNPKSGSIGMASIRTIVESRYADSLMLPDRHNMLATMMMVDPELRISVAERIATLRDGEPLDIEVSRTASESLIRLAAYQNLAKAIREHIHDTRECPIILNMN